MRENAGGRMEMGGGQQSLDDTKVSVFAATARIFSANAGMPIKISGAGDSDELFSGCACLMRQCYRSLSFPPLRFLPFRFEKARWHGAAPRRKSPPTQRMQEDALDERHQRAIEAIAEELNLPAPHIEPVYAEVLDELETRASISTFLPIFAAKRVKHIFRSHQ